ncbi:MAG: class I SAM-dependent methyltransferase, partial [Chloroflexi bacterium]|nr:class I SAM-dependent methyltransferase [Chloroflexota bacterium]
MLSSPTEYSEDAQIYLDLLTEAAGSAPRTLLELGSGAGNTASHYKRSVQATLVDRSLQMLAISRRLNPHCEHVQGDMGTVRLGRTFDAVLVHDAVQYLTI